MVWRLGERYPVRPTRRPRFRAIAPLVLVDAGDHAAPGGDHERADSLPDQWDAPAASQRVEVETGGGSPANERADGSPASEGGLDVPSDAARLSAVTHPAVAGPHHGAYEPEHARAWLSRLAGEEGEGAHGRTAEAHGRPEEDLPSGFGSATPRGPATTEPVPPHPWRFVAGPGGDGDVAASGAPYPDEDPGADAVPEELRASSHAEQLTSEADALGVEPALSSYDGAGGTGVPAEDVPPAHLVQAEPGGHEHDHPPATTEGDPEPDPPGSAANGGSADEPSVPHGPHVDARTPDGSGPNGRSDRGTGEPEPAADASGSAPEPVDPPAPTPGPVPGLANLRLPERQGPTELPTSRAIVVGVANQKGGVGKTTTTVSLAAAVAQAGVRTLVVDLDPQGNATTGLGLRAEEGDPSSYGVLVEGLPVADAIQRTEVDLLDVLPSSLDLAGAEVELVPAFSRELRLRRALEMVTERYDLILVDCPPSLGLLTINALVASDQVLVPIQCEYYALEGLGQLMRTVQLVGDNLNRDLELGGVVLTMYDGRTKLSQQVVDEVRAYFGAQAYETVIPRTVRLSEAPSFGQPITVFDPTSRGSRAYERLAQEVIARLGLPSSQPPEPVDGRSALDRLLGGPAPAPTSPSAPTDATAPEQPEGQP
jgi:chromosome partitioning protein